MNSSLFSRQSTLLLLCLLLVCCNELNKENVDVANEGNLIRITDEQLTKDPNGKSDASALAIFLDFNFEGVVKTRFNFDLDRVIEQQLLYTVGQLNADHAVGRLDQLKLTDIQVESLDEGGYEVRYQASLLVAWSRKDRIPNHYILTLPYDTTFESQRNFTEAYKDKCVSYEAHDVDEGSIWYYFRPRRVGCELKEEDIRRFEASISLSPVMTSGKYPEYHKVWEDNTFRSLVIFGHAKEEGVLEDIEIEIDLHQVPEPTRELIDKYLEAEFKRHRIKKVQIQYKQTSLQTLIKEEVPKTDSPHAFELVVKGKKSKLMKLWEVAFSSTGKFISIDQILNRNSTHLEY